MLILDHSERSKSDILLQIVLILDHSEWSKSDILLQIVLILDHSERQNLIDFASDCAYFRSW